MNKLLPTNKMSSRAKKIGIGVLALLGFFNSEGANADGWINDAQKQFLYGLHVHT